MAKSKVQSKRTNSSKGSRSSLRISNGEYKRQGLVTIEMDSFQDGLFASEKLRRITETQPSILAQNRSDSDDAQREAAA